MDEKQIIKGNIIDINSFLNIGIVASLIGTIIFFCIYQSGWEYLGYGYGTINYNGEYMAGVIICGVIFVSLFLFKFIFAKAEITVTDKRVYGKVAFGKRVDLPLDSISSVGIGFEWLKSVSVATSSGVIKFSLVRNYQEVYQAISDLLLERQKKGNNGNGMPQGATSNYGTSTSVDDLKKYKGLLDIGAITQDEFEQKKKQILGL